MSDATEPRAEGAPTSSSQRVSGRLAGRHVGPYQLLALLGQGSMGAVYLAEHEDDERRVALKVMGRHLLEDAESLRRFELELQTLVKLRHPAVVSVHDAGRLSDGRPWYAMDYVEGETLREALKRGLSLDEGLDVLEQMALALGHAHAQGLVHRDFKPDNVLIDREGVARLTDFGLARGEERDERLTRTDEILGTPRYMAPEQVSRSLGEVGPWSDVWGVGAVLYELLTGRTPYMGATAVECFAQLTEGQPILAPRAVAPQADPALEAVCLRALSRDPAARYEDGEELARALAAARARRGPARLLPLLGSLAGISLLLGLSAVLWALVRSPVPGAPAAARDAVPPALTAAWAEGRAVEARALLTDGMELAERPLLLALTGEAAAALRAAGDLEPRDRARIAALAGDLVACQRALGEVEAGPRRGLSWELAPLVLGLRPERPDGLSASLAGWGHVAQAEEHLAAGRVPLAAQSFLLAERGAETDLRRTAQLGRVRVHVARGEGELAVAALERLEKELSRAASPLERAGVLAWRVQAELCRDVPQGEAGGRLQVELKARLDQLRRLAPGLPLVADCLGLTGAARLAPPSSPVQRVRAQATGDGAAARAALVQLGAAGEGSFSQAELVACARGLDGPQGLLLARGAALAALAEAGPSEEGARRAAGLLEAATRLRPASPAAWLALTRARLVLHQVQEAGQALEQAERLVPGDAWARLLRAQLELARLQPARIEADLADPADREKERALAGELARVLSGYQAARTAAAPDSALALEARLRAAEVGRELAERLARAGDAARAGEERARLTAELEVVTRGHDVAAVPSARQRLSQALLGEGPIRQAEEALAGAVRAPAPLAVLQAWQILAGAGGEASIPAGHALRAVASDLPGRALLALRRALRTRDGEERRRELARARLLAPALPVVVLAEERELGPGRDDASWRALSDLIERAPELTGAVLSEARAAHGLEELAAEALERGGDPQAAALVWITLAERTDDPAGRARLRQRAWLAVEARLQARPLQPSPAAHLLRALAWGADPPEELRSDVMDDLLAARAGAPWEWTAAQRRVTLAREPEPVQAWRDEALALGLLEPMKQHLPPELAGRIGKDQALLGALQTARALRETGLPRTAVALLLPYARTPSPVEPAELRALREALPGPAAAALAPYVVTRDLNRGWDRALEAGLRAGHEALVRVLPAGLHARLQPSHLAGRASWALLPLSGPDAAGMWLYTRDLERPESQLVTLARLLGLERQGWGRRRGTARLDPGPLARAVGLGLQDPELLDDELLRYLEVPRVQEAALAWSATVGLAIMARVDERALSLGSQCFRQEREDEDDAAALRLLRLGWSLSEDLVGVVEGQDLVLALRADLALDIAGRLPPGPEREDLLRRGLALAQEVDPEQVPARAESPTLAWWRVLRARAVAGDSKGAQAAWQRVQPGLRLGAGADWESLERLAHGRADPFLPEIKKACPEAVERLESIRDGGDQWERWMGGDRRGRDGDRDRQRDGDRPR